MSSIIPKVSVIGGGTKEDRTGFEPLPDTDSAGAAVIIAARKSRRHKNLVALKIGVIIVGLSAVVAGLTAFLLTKGADTAPAASNIAGRQSRVMKINIEDGQTVQSVAEANNHFSRDCFAQMSEEADGNVLLSPYSASVALSMVAAGAKGDTLQQLMTGLHLNDLKVAGAGYHQIIPALRTNDNFTMETGNAAFVQQDFKILDNYKETLHTKFHTDISSLNFGESEEAARTINSWVSDMTNKKINQLVDKNMIDGMTKLILVNALYFKGDWEKKFNEKMTVKDKFTVSQNKEVEVDMMRITSEFPLAELVDLDSNMIELPYKGDRIVMQILLPKQRSGLDAVQDKLSKSSIDWNKVFEENQRKIKVELRLPKFKLSQSHDMSSYLKSLGMKDMFASGKADFSGMDGSKNLYVGFVRQDVFVEVNEEGSEAAAATGVGMMLRSMPLPPEKMTVDHPFIFFLRDKLTGMLLFQGKVVDPTSK